MPKMRAVQIGSPKGPLEIVEREVPQPSPGLVRIRVKACGVCHSDWSRRAIGQAAMDSEDTLAFSVLSGVRSMNEVFPLDRAAEAYDHVMSGKARFRAVLTIGL